MVKGQHNILHSRTENGQTRWVRVGTAFPLKTGEGFNLCLDALPTGPWDGKLVMKPSDKTERDWPPQRVSMGPRRLQRLHTLTPWSRRMMRLLKMVDATNTAVPQRSSDTTGWPWPKRTAWLQSWEEAQSNVLECRNAIGELVVPPGAERGFEFTFVDPDSGKTIVVRRLATESKNCYVVYERS